MPRSVPRVVVAILALCLSAAAASAEASPAQVRSIPVALRGYDNYNADVQGKWHEDRRQRIRAADRHWQSLQAGDAPAAE